MVFLNSVEQDLTVHRGIRPEDLEVKVDGKRTRVVSLSLNSSPRRIIMMVDTSGSMQVSPQNSDWGISLRTAVFSVDSVPSNTSVAMLTFSDKPQLESDGFEQRQQIRRRVLELSKREPKGHTTLYDSINQALSLFETPQPGDAIYLVSDGGDNKSKISPTKLREKLVAHGIRVFVFLVPYEKLVSVEEEEGVALMDKLAEFTGGYVIRIPWHEIRRNEQTWLARSATQISDQVQAMYEMELDMSGAVGSERVRVVFANRKRRKNTFAYPRQLAPCLPDP